MTTGPFVPKGEEVTPGTRTCGYKPKTATGHCGEPGTWHVMWDGVHEHSTTCDEHMTLIRQRWMYLDRHPLGADCTMPGALWIFFEDRCEVPTEGAPALAVARAIAGGS